MQHEEFSQFLSSLIKKKQHISIIDFEEYVEYSFSLFLLQITSYRTVFLWTVAN